MKTSDYLKLVRAEIDTKDKWCQGRLETDDGRCCLVGAIHRVYQKYSNEKNKSFFTTEYGQKRGIYSFLLKVTNTGLPAFNDTHTHEEVLSTLDLAILAAEQTNN